MSIATLTSKGQVTIPKPVREKLHLSSGDRIEFVDVGDGRIELVAVTRDVRSLRGMLGPAKRTVSVEEMEDAVAEAAVQRYVDSEK